jgi:hypothetical protein
MTSRHGIAGRCSGGVPAASEEVDEGADMTARLAGWLSRKPQPSSWAPLMDAVILGAR